LCSTAISWLQIASPERILLSTLPITDWLVDNCQVDAEMALEYAIQTGMTDSAREGLFLKTSDPNRSVTMELHSPVCVIRLFSGF
jgi:hypothetical protein